jgi:hypothetical protein
MTESNPATKDERIVAFKEEVAGLHIALDESNSKKTTEAKQPMTERLVVESLKDQSQQIIPESDFAAREEQMGALKEEVAGLQLALDELNSKKPTEAKQPMTESDPAVKDEQIGAL